MAAERGALGGAHAGEAEASSTAGTSGSTAARAASAGKRRNCQKSCGAEGQAGGQARRAGLGEGRARGVVVGGELVRAGDARSRAPAAPARPPRRPAPRWRRAPSRRSPPRRAAPASCGRRRGRSATAPRCRRADRAGRAAAGWAWSGRRSRRGWRRRPAPPWRWSCRCRGRESWRAARLPVHSLPPASARQWASRLPAIKARRRFDSRRHGARYLGKPLWGGSIMLDVKAGDRLANLWDAGKAAGMSEPELLLYRSNLLGADKRITNYGGGNTSAKVMEKDPLTGETVEVLWVKGSGGDVGHDQARRLRHALHVEARGAEGALPRAGARGRDGGLPAALHLQPQRARRLDRHAAARLRAAQARRPHARRRDHRHRRLEGFAGADARRSSATRSAGCRGSGRATSSGCGWRSSAARTRAPRGVVLESHGLFTWGDDAKGCYDTTLEIINRAIAWLETKTAGKPAFGGPRHAALAPEERRRVAAALMPAIRGHDLEGRAHGRALRRQRGGAGVRRRPRHAAAGGARDELPRPFPAHQDPAAGGGLRPRQARPRRDAGRASGGGRGLPEGLCRLLRALPACRQPGRCATRTRSSISCRGWG